MCRSCIHIMWPNWHTLALECEFKLVFVAHPQKSKTIDLCSLSFVLTPFIMDFCLFIKNDTLHPSRHRNALCLSFKNKWTNQACLGIWNPPNYLRLFVFVCLSVLPSGCIPWCGSLCTADPAEVDWRGLECGERVLRLRQRPVAEAQQRHAELRLQVQLCGDQWQGGMSLGEVWVNNT